MKFRDEVLHKHPKTARRINSMSALAAQSDDPV